MSLVANIAARTAYTAVLRNDSAPLVGDPPFGAQDRTHEEKLFGWVYKQPGDATFEDCKDIVERVWFERGPSDVTALLQRFGISKLSDLFMGLYNRFYRYAEKVICLGVSPDFGMTNDDEPVNEESRDRWLLWHSESECLWEVRGKLADELDDGLVSDVSGIPEYEKEWREKHTTGVHHRQQGFYQSNVEEEL